MSRSSYEQGAQERWVDYRKEYEILKQRLVPSEDDFGGIRIDEADLEVLSQGEAVFLWESPLATSIEETEAMARQASSDMVPEPDREILTGILMFVSSVDFDLEEIERICEQIVCLSEDMQLIFGVTADPDLEQGCIRFRLATSEGTVSQKQRLAAMQAAKDEPGPIHN